MYYGWEKVLGIRIRHSTSKMPDPEPTKLNPRKDWSTTVSRAQGGRWQWSEIPIPVPPLGSPLTQDSSYSCLSLLCSPVKEMGLVRLFLWSHFFSGQVWVNWH